MRLLQVQQVLASVICVSAFAARDTPFNLTTTAPWDPTQSDEPPTEPEPWPFSESRANRPHPEISEDGFEVTTSTWMGPDQRFTAPTNPDVGSVIESFLNTARPVTTSTAGIHFERSDDGWGELTQSHPAPSDIPPPPIRVTEGGISSAIAAGAPSNNLPQETKYQSQAPRVTSPPVDVVPQATPPPAITFHGVTLRPIPVTSVRVATLDGKPITVSSVVNYRYVAGTATLQLGASTIINNVAIVLKVDSSGSTVLVAGDQTTTLPPRAQAAQQAQATSSVQAVKITTTVIDGTTKYLFGGKTLAPGQAITVNGVPISITIQDHSTILVVGNVTTTFVAGAFTTTTPEWGASTAATFGVPRSDSNEQPTATSANAGNGKSIPMSSLASPLLKLAELVRQIV